MLSRVSGLIDRIARGGGYVKAASDGSLSAKNGSSTAAPLWSPVLVGVCSGNLSLTTSFVDVAGATITLPAVVGKWYVAASVYFQFSGALDGGANLQAQLVCAAGATADNAALVVLNADASDTGFLATTFQQWLVTQASGTPVLKLQGKKSGGTGASTINLTHTKLVAVWCGNP